MNHLYYLIKINTQKGWTIFQTSGKSRTIVGKKIFNPGRASVIVAIIGNAAAGRNSKLIAATAFN